MFVGDYDHRPSSDYVWVFPLSPVTIKKKDRVVSCSFHSKTKFTCSISICDLYADYICIHTRRHLSGEIGNHIVPIDNIKE